MSVFACARDRLVRLLRDGRSWTAETALEGAGARCVAAHDGRVLVGSRGRGALLSVDWKAVALPADSMPYALVTRDGELLAGMSDGRILSSGDRGESWDEIGVRVGSILAMAAMP